MIYTITKNIKLLSLTETSSNLSTINISANNILTFHSYGNSMYIVLKYKSSDNDGAFSNDKGSNPFGVNTFKLNYNETINPDTGSAFGTLSEMTTFFKNWYNLAISGGGSGATANAEYQSPSDFTATYTSSTTITLSGVPFTITDSSQIVYIKSVSNSGITNIFVNGSNGISMTVSSNVITITGVYSPFNTGDVYEVGINSQSKSYDSSTNSNMVSVLNPIYNKYTSVEHIVDTTNDAIGTYRVAFDMEGYKGFSLQWNITGGVTMTIFASNVDTSDTTSDTDWIDITSSITGNVSEVDNAGIVSASNILYDKIMIKRVTSDSTNASDIFIRKVY